jgi:hypothetical protein
LTFFNQHNQNGFQVDGFMDTPEKQFDNTFSPWEMVSGHSGTYFRAIDILFNGPDTEFQNPKEFLDSWYYDSNTPIGETEDGAPFFENGFTVCTALLNKQVSAIFKRQPGQLGPRCVFILIPVNNYDSTIVLQLCWFSRGMLKLLQMKQVCSLNRPAGLGTYEKS